MGVQIQLNTIASSTIKEAIYAAKREVPPIPADFKSYLGTPVYSNLIIPSGRYEELDGTVVPYNGIRLDTVLMTVSQSKNIISSAIVGRAGTIKQYISDGDYIVNVEAIVYPETWIYPEGLEPRNEAYQVGSVPAEAMETLSALARVPDSLEVESEFLGFFQIDNIVITDISAKQEQGTRSHQSVSISAVSDKLIRL